MSTTPFPLGVYIGNPNGSDAAAESTFDTFYQQFSSALGANPTFIDAYIDQTQNISDWVSNASWQAWSNAQSPDAKDMTPVIGLPMTSTAAGALTPDQYYKNFAAGDYDSMIQGVVKAWAAQGFTTQYWRPGWEMNLSSMPSYAGADAATQDDWVKAFQHISTVLHAAGATNGVNVQVVWNPSITNYSYAEATTSLYPGNQYVDVIGADVYSDLHPYGSTTALYDWDKSGATLNSIKPVYDVSLQQWASDPVNLEHYYTDPASTQWSLDGSDGHSLSLQNLLDFAKAQGKPIAIAETGAGSTSDGAGVSDNPTFVQWLHTTLANSGVPVKFVNIWDSNGGSNYEFSSTSDDKPLELAAWAKYFGAQTSTSTASPPTSPPSMPSSPVTAPITIGVGSDVIALQLSEDAWQGNAQAIVSVDGTQIGGTQTITASHAAGQKQILNIDGNWGPGTHTVSVDFLNDAYGDSSSTDRNLYVSGASYNGTAATGAPLSLMSSGTQSLTVGTAIARTVTVGAGPDTIDLKMSEDAYQGNAQFTVSADGKQIGGILTAMALHAAGQSQDFLVEGDFGAGKHAVSVDFLNDLYANTPAADRNLYVTGASYDGAVQQGAALLLASSGAKSFNAISSTTYNEGSAGGTVTTLGNDTVQIGSGAVTINANGPTVDIIGAAGPMKFIGGTGNDTVTAGSGASTITGGSGTLSFTAGSGNATIATGNGKEVFDLINGKAGGSLTIDGFNSGTDVIHLQGYSGTGVRTETVTNGSTQIMLTEGTKITLTGFVADSSHPVFG